MATINGTTSNDNLAGTGVADTINAEQGNDTVQAGLGNDTVFGDSDNDLLFGNDGNDSIDSGSGADSASGGAGNDFLLGGSGADTLLGGLGDDRIDGGASSGDVIQGFLGNDTLTGGTSADSVLGGFGDDTFLEDEGNDTLDGGDGDDVFVGADEDDGLGSDRYIGGAGFDVINYSLLAVQQNSRIDLTNTLVGFGVATGDTFDGIESVIGTNFRDTIIGNASNNILNGFNDSDELFGGLGDDILTGGASRDTYDGGAGADVIFGDSEDVVSYATSLFGVTVNLFIDDGEAQTGQLGDAVGDFLFGIREVDGSNTTDSLTGDSGINKLSGLNGSDSIRGGAGADTLNGGLGVDTLIYIGSSARVIVDLQENRPSGGDAEGDIVTNLTFENLLGSSFDDLLRGSAVDNRIGGGNGNDIIVSREGNDVLTGENGNDILSGGLGNDTLQGGLNNDTYNQSVGTGNDSIFDLGGLDVLAVTALGDIVASAQVGDDLVITFADGTVTTIDGHFNAATTIETATDGIQSVTIATSLIGNNAGGIVSGTDKAELLNGRGGDDLLFAGGGKDTLLGGAGDDRLASGLGADEIFGGKGVDTFRFGLTRGGGADLVRDFVSGVDKIELNRDGFDLGQHAKLANILKFGEAPADGLKFVVTDGVLRFDNDWEDAAGREVLAVFTNAPKAVSDFILA